MGMSMSTVVVTDTPQLIYFNDSGDVSHVVLSPTMTATPMIRPFRDTEGVGGFDAAVDGSITPVEFKIVVGVETIQLESIQLMIFDSGAIAPDKYGAIDELANGVTATAYVAAIDTTVDLLAGRTMRHIADWASVTWQHVYSPSGPGTQYVDFNWVVGPIGPAPESEVFRPGDEIIITINDDLTDLNDHIFTGHGQIVSSKVKLGTSATFTPATSYQIARTGDEVKVPSGDSLYAAVDPGQAINVMGVTIYE